VVLTILTIKTIKTCACGKAFEPSSNRQVCCSKKCTKKIANRRLRGESLSERVVRLKGRRCHGCKSTKPGRRYAFFWEDEDREAERLDVAGVACYGCNKIGNALKLGQKREFDAWDRLAERGQELSAHDLLGDESDWLVEAIASGDLTIRFGWEIGVNYGPPAPPEPGHYIKPPAPPSPVAKELDPRLPVKKAILDLVIRRLTGELRVVLDKAA
jgi:hypothetical protein